MINKINQLTLKIAEIEEKLNLLSKDIDTSINNSFYAVNKRLLNYLVTDTQTIPITEIQLEKKQKICINANINFTTSTKQYIEFSLVVDNICIAKSINEYSIGNHTAQIIENYKSLVSTISNISIQAKSLDNKTFSIIEVSMLFLGVSNESKISYNAISFNDKFLLSYTENNNLYYLIAEKLINTYAKPDFNFLCEAKKHCLCVDNNNIYICKIDLIGNLLLQNLNKSLEIFIDNNVSNVCAYFFNEMIYICYIKENKLFNVNFKNNILSNINEMQIFNTNISNISFVYNKFSDKLFLIVNTTTCENYMVEVLNHHTTIKERLHVSLDYSISTYEVNNGI